MRSAAAIRCLGAIYGTILVSYGKTYFSEMFPNLWYFLMGSVFILVTRFFPEGLAGAVNHLGPMLGRKIGSLLAAARRRPRHAALVPSRIRLLESETNRTLKETWSSMSTELKIKDLTVSFDGFKAVDNLNFSVEHEELRVVIGPNGAGKTTLLDLICGKTKPTGGSIRFNGRELSRMHENSIVNYGVGRKFQTPSIYPKLTVFENLEISFPRGRGTWGSLFFKQTQDVRDRIREVAREIFLSDHLADAGRALEPRPETVARDRHGADRRSEADAAWTSRSPA